MSSCAVVPTCWGRPEKGQHPYEALRGEGFTMGFEVLNWGVLISVGGHVKIQVLWVLDQEKTSMKFALGSMGKRKTLYIVKKYCEGDFSKDKCNSHTLESLKIRSSSGRGRCVVWSHLSLGLSPKRGWRGRGAGDASGTDIAGRIEGCTRGNVLWKSRPWQEVRAREVS